MPYTQKEHETLSAAVARRLRGRMGELQLKGTDVAAAIGMTQGSFSRRYTGSAAWELDELELLQQHFPALSIAFLLGMDPGAGEPAATTGTLVRIDPASLEQPEQQQQQQQQVFVIRPQDRALFTGPIAKIA